MKVDPVKERLNRGYSIRSLSELTGVHQHAIRRLERGESIHPASAKKIADVYGCKVTDFWPVDRGNETEDAIAS